MVLKWMTAEELKERNSVSGNLSVYIHGVFQTGCLFSDIGMNIELTEQIMGSNLVILPEGHSFIRTFIEPLLSQALG